eukprot:14637550-Alexandrium_andersonii.AAC.1
MKLFVRIGFLGQGPENAAPCTATLAKRLAATESRAYPGKSTRTHRTHPSSDSSAPVGMAGT